MPQFPQYLRGWTLLQQLGEGGSATVFRAKRAPTWWDVRGRFRGPRGAVALKVLISRKPDDVARLHAEADVLLRLQHRGIVRALSAPMDTGREWVLPLELVHGERLDQAPPFDASSVFHHLAEVLAFTHEAGVVHRDVKPENVFLRADGRPVLLDFGIARQAFDMNVTAPFVTQPYADPKRTDIGPPHPAEDVYAFGVMLYRRLTENWPDQDHAEKARRSQKIADNKRLAACLDTGTEGCLADVVRACTQRERECRPTMRQVARWLVAGHPVDSDTEPVAEPIHPLVPSETDTVARVRVGPGAHRAAAAAAALFAGFLVVIGAVVLMPRSTGYSAPSAGQPPAQPSAVRSTTRAPWFLSTAEYRLPSTAAWGGILPAGGYLTLFELPRDDGGLMRPDDLPGGGEALVQSMMMGKWEVDIETTAGAGKGTASWLRVREAGASAPRTEVELLGGLGSGAILGAPVAAGPGWAVPVYAFLNFDCTPACLEVDAWVVLLSNNEPPVLIGPAPVEKFEALQSYAFYEQNPKIQTGVLGIVEDGSPTRARVVGMFLSEHDVEDSDSWQFPKSYSMTRGLSGFRLPAVGPPLPVQPKRQEREIDAMKAMDERGCDVEATFCALRQGSGECSQLRVEKQRRCGGIESLDPFEYFGGVFGGLEPK